jgi:hypothetical protein
MIDVLKKNNAILLGENSNELSEQEFHRLKKENLLAIQKRFYDLMENNPLIFKIPHLLHQRKKHIKEVTFIKNGGGNIEEEKISFYKTTTKKERMINAQIVNLT